MEARAAASSSTTNTIESSLGIYRKFNLEAGAGIRIQSPHAATMSFDYRTANGKPDSDAFGLRRIKGGEKLFGVAGRKAWTGVFDGDEEAGTELPGAYQ